MHMHIMYDDKHVTCYKDVSEHYTVIAMGTLVPMSKVEGSWIWFYGYIFIIVIYTRMLSTGRFAHVNLSATG